MKKESELSETEIWLYLAFKVRKEKKEHKENVTPLPVWY
jgi:hypothetical protein